eukprot:TRINITY_DN35387_c0_g1_i1.p1 TRINITY_DN35387_c0_g1~~TRINITY_DN35387_c0_g1_i1.p1  ORF type:complete len:100 (+),score=29.00 TRINITY_DN35387_c0_g1_i1:52-351(+)
MVEKEPSRDTAYGAFCAFDDHNTGSLSTAEVQAILLTGGEPLSREEVDALMCEIVHLSEGGKIGVEALCDFLYGKEPLHVKDNSEALGVGQLTAGGALK